MQHLLRNEDLVHRLVVEPGFRLPQIEPDPLLQWSEPFPDEATLAGVVGTPPSDSDVTSAAAVASNPGLFSFPDTRARALRRRVSFWHHALTANASSVDTNQLIVNAVKGVLDGLAGLTPHNKVEAVKRM